MRRLITYTIFLLALTATPVQGGQPRELLVSAAASLTDAFSDIEAAFEHERPDVDVILNLASSGTLYRQIEQGAPVDVYASANPLWMARAVDHGFADKDAVTVFAHNTLVLAVPADNPAGITGVQDLTTSAVQRVAMGAPATVPAGLYARDALNALGIFDSLMPKYIFGESVRQVLDYLVRGEVDCGFIYRTDAVRAGQAIQAIQTMTLKQPVAYPLAPLKNAGDPLLASEFVDFILSQQGAELLRARGFERP